MINRARPTCTERKTGGAEGGRPLHRPHLSPRGGGVGSSLMRSQSHNAKFANRFQASADFFSTLTILSFTAPTEHAGACCFGPDSDLWPGRKLGLTRN